MHLTSVCTHSAAEAYMLKVHVVDVNQLVFFHLFAGQLSKSPSAFHLKLTDLIKYYKIMIIPNFLQSEALLIIQFYDVLRNTDK